MITAAADGSALSNPGPAGWAWYIDDDCWARGGWPLGTNNMGELMAVLDLLQQTAAVTEPLHVLCDSQYVINSVTRWMPGWKRRGWKKADGKPVLNVDLMKQLDAALQGRKVTFEWVKGHAGHRMNEAADSLARAAATAWATGDVPSPGPGFGASPEATVPVPDLPDQDALFDAVSGSHQPAEPVLSDTDLPVSDELAGLYRSVGWTAYLSDIRILEQGIRGSLRVVTARLAGRLIGLARVIGDGATITYLQDVLVHPEHQRSGLGRRLVDEVLRPFNHVRQTVLMTDAEPRQRAFYESMGFTEMHDLPDGGLRGFVRMS